MFPVVQESWNTSKMNETQFTSSQSQVGYPLSGFSIGYFNSPASFQSIPPNLYENCFNVLMVDIQGLKSI